VIQSEPDIPLRILDSNNQRRKQIPASTIPFILSSLLTLSVHSVDAAATSQPTCTSGGSYWLQPPTLASNSHAPLRFEPNRWTAEYAGTDEIEQYFTRMIKKYNVGAFVTYGAEVVSATWSEARAAWRLEIKTEDGVKEEWTHVIINGHGILNRPKIPTFEGEEEFKGVIMHTARFDRSVPLEGKRVAVIGNGSSGVSFDGLRSSARELF